MLGPCGKAKEFPIDEMRRAIDAISAASENIILCIRTSEVVSALEY
jgi:hypothetical protein